MTRDEALRMAIEAIENADYHNDLQAIAIIKEALAQPEQGPVACKECHLKDLVYDLLGELKVANLKLSVRAKRTWVGLTEEDLKLLSAEWRIVYGAWVDDFARDIEAKLKEKNA